MTFTFQPDTTGNGK